MCTFVEDTYCSEVKPLILLCNKQEAKVLDGSSFIPSASDKHTSNGANLIGTRFSCEKLYDGIDQTDASQ